MTFEGPRAKALRKADAGNRSLRTFLTGLSIDVLVGVTLILTTYFADSNSWGDIEWTILGFSLFKSVLQAVGAYVLRAFLDPSRIPTPLPPSDPGPPESPTVGERGEGSAVSILVVVLVVILIVFVLTRLF